MLSRYYEWLGSLQNKPDPLGSGIESTFDIIFVYFCYFSAIVGKLVTTASEVTLTVGSMQVVLCGQTQTELVVSGYARLVYKGEGTGRYQCYCEMLYQ